MPVSRLGPVLAVGAVAAMCAAMCAAVPAMAVAAKPASAPTHLTIHAAKSHPAPKRHDPFVVHLNSRHDGLAGQASNLSLWERNLKSSGATTKWSNVTADGTVSDNGSGEYVVTGITPNDPHPKAGHKDQFQVRFAGDDTHRASRSSVITVVVKPAK
jgi:hypothetical protein